MAKSLERSASLVGRVEPMFLAAAFRKRSDDFFNVPRSHFQNECLVTGLPAGGYGRRMTVVPVPWARSWPAAFLIEPSAAAIVLERWRSLPSAISSWSNALPHPPRMRHVVVAWA